MSTLPPVSLANTVGRSIVETFYANASADVRSTLRRKLEDALSSFQYAGTWSAHWTLQSRQGHTEVYLSRETLLPADKSPRLEALALATSVVEGYLRPAGVWLAGIGGVGVDGVGPHIQLSVSRSPWQLAK